jgi:hypothetical protein
MSVSKFEIIWKRNGYCKSLFQYLPGIMTIARIAGRDVSAGPPWHEALTTRSQRSTDSAVGTVACDVLCIVSSEHRRVEELDTLSCSYGCLNILGSFYSV